LFLLSARQKNRPSVRPLSEISKKLKKRGNNVEALIKLALCAAVGFILTALLGLFIIPALRRAHVRQSIKADGPVWHKSKEGTPTMGGVTFILASLAVAILWAVWQGDYNPLALFAFAFVFGCIGFLDDYAKLRHKENTGLSAPAKFLLQLAASILFLVVLRHPALGGHLSPTLTIPFTTLSLQLPWPVYMVFAALVMVGCVNAVNLTDGVDGLSSSVTLPVMLTYTALGLSISNKLGFGAFSAGLFGCLLGFLLYNHHPAKVFMGDTGSLFLGGAVCGLAFAYNMPLILIFVGVIYIAETLSDIIQVTYFKATHGKRIFLMAPLHHHFEKKGWSEDKVVTVFTLVSCIGCILGFLAFGNVAR
jgi:phospho-N-acetylmuramoyl-pentapeptide-transferase